MMTEYRDWTSNELNNITMAIFRLRDKYTFYLNENFDNIYPSKQEIELSKKIASDIISLTEDDYTHIITISGLPTLGALRLRYENYLSFIKNLNIYVVLYSNMEDAMILTNNCVYEYDEQSDKFIKKMLELSIKEKDTNIPEIPLIMNKDSYKEASILFLFPKICTYTQKHLSFIIRHELIHLKDGLNRQISQDRINSDKLQTYATTDKYPNQATPKSRMLFDYIKNNCELLNISELHAYTITAMEEISELEALDTQLLLSESDDNIKNFLNNHSNTFHMFRQIKTQLQMSKQILTVEDKINFTKLFITKIFGKQNHDGDYPYGSDFKINGQYTTKSFDIFIDKLTNNIEEYFEDNCVRYFRQCKAVIEYHKSQFSGISVQRPKPLLRYSINEHMKMEER